MMGNQDITGNARDKDVRTNPVGSTSNFSTRVNLTGIFTPDFDPVQFGKNLTAIYEQKSVSYSASSQTVRKFLGKNVPKRELEGNYRISSPLTPIKNVELANAVTQGELTDE